MTLTKTETEDEDEIQQLLDEPEADHVPRLVEIRRWKVVSGENGVEHFVEEVTSAWK